MRALTLAFAAITLFACPAQAVLLGSASRDPNGLRRSVVSVENSLGELCSGAVIAPDLVLTAAHCVIDPAAYRVVAVDRAFKRQRMGIAAVVMHPTFVGGTTPRTQPGIDLAILRLERPLGPDFLPLDPNLTGAVDVGDEATIAGFGVLNERRRQSAHTLRHVNLVSLGPLETANRVLILADRKRLAETGGAGACRGDSGGPVIAASADGYLLYGIVSWSSGAMRTRTRSACGGLTAFTPVAEHLGWIRQAVRSLSAAEGVWTRR
jgi:secreted trypsin-like serine protease